MAATSQTYGAVRDYHQGLAQHLLGLIRKTKSSSTVTTTPSDTKPPSTSNTPPPGNPRQLSDSSLESNSKISSGQTTESKPSGGDGPSTDTKSQEVVVAENVASSPNDSGIEGDGERSERDTEGSQSGSASGSDRQDQTARPDVHRSQFLPAPNSHRMTSMTKPTTSVAESSTAGARRYAMSKEVNNQSSQSSSNLSVRPNPNPEPTPHAESVTREDEHRKAWETDGKRVWRNIAPHFELRLERKPRAGSNESSAISPARSIHSGLSGAGPGTAIRADPVFVPDNDIESKESERLSVSLPTDRETFSEVSRPEEAVAQSQSSVSPSIAKPNIKQTSTLQQRQARLEFESEPEVHAPLVTVIDNTPTKANVAGPSHTALIQNQPSPSDEEQNEYQLRREARLRKKEQSLARRIGHWRTQVVESGLHDSDTLTPPEIEPHLPSPTKEASRLRFEPLPTNMPDLLGAHSPDFQIPPFRRVDDNRKLRALRLIPEHKNSESDVDLLIRLTELNRISSATSNSFRGAYPPGGSPYGSHQPLGLRTGAGSGIVTGAIETHSLRVKDSMPTPKPRSQRLDFGIVDPIPTI